ncbi:MAG TPA: head GIN domain-containing protein [Ignavibacteria bacterium]|nr:hypothetical protein [Bacteroidota bacterium]HRI86253.1 head GIN domain-containing protein [Ignavibacteria bacterium]HRJ98177.1 head GIN domain-containing protein [Ignavibacteria bacterium]
MKNLIYSVLLLIFTFTSADQIHSQSIYGDGNIVKESRDISSFNKIEINGLVNVYLKQGTTESVTVEADKNLKPYILTSVKNGIMNISTKEDFNLKKSTKLNVYVTLNNITDLECNGVGNVKTESKLDLNDINIENNSVGNIDLEINSNKLILENNSVGNTILTGNIDIGNIEHNGVGNIKAFDLKSDILTIESNAVGNAEVSSEREIYIELNGMGNINYKGAAAVKKLEKNGFGNIKKY